MKFSNNLKKYLENTDLSLNELAKKLSVPVSTVHGWINGVEPKSVQDIRKVSDYLGVSVDELCFGELTSQIETDLKITIGSESFRI